MLEPTRILAIRHGETAWNALGRVQGHLDIALNETGRLQARRLASALAHEDIDRVFSSDLLRALDTAQALARPRGLNVLTDVGLRERHFGEFQGRRFVDVEAASPEQALRWRRRDPDFSPPGGESLNTFYKRCIDAATRLALAHPGKTLVIVSHGGVLDALYRAACRIDLQAPRSWQLGNAGINRLLHTEAGFTLVGWGDTAHLEIALDDDGVQAASSTFPTGKPDAVGPLA